MLPNDFFKLIYQNSHGPHHLNTEKLRTNFELELNSLSISPDTILEYIGNNYYRIYLNPNWSFEIKELVFKAFKESNIDYEPNEDLFFRELDLLFEMINKKDISIDFNSYLNELKSYKENGFGMISHTKQYKEYYQPHYVVIKEKYLNELINKL
jgi:hypothetical protein